MSFNYKLYINLSQKIEFKFYYIKDKKISYLYSIPNKAYMENIKINNNYIYYYCLFLYIFIIYI